MLLNALSFLVFRPSSRPAKADQNDYITYHCTIVRVQYLIAHQNCQEALALYSQVLKTYLFVFSREYKVATQLAIQVGQKQLAFAYLYG